MRFSGTHKLTSYLMVLSAMAALLLSPEISLEATLLALGGVLLSWFVEPARHPLERFTLVWNVATVAFLAYVVIDVVRGASVIVGGAHFLLFVLVNKLFNRASSRDYLQAYAVSFLVLVVATTLNNSLSFAVCFVGYGFCATWALILCHLRREMEESYLLKHSEGAQSEKVEVDRILSSRRVVGASFLAGTALLSLLMLVGATLVFVLFPRIGFGLFVGQKREGTAMAGFRESVELGHHGVVRDNPAVVMRVVFPKVGWSTPLRWRGSVFDRYERGVWSHSAELLGRTQVVLPADGLYLLNSAPGLPRLGAAAVRGRLLRQEIYLEPLDSGILFAADRPVALEVGRPGIAGRGRVVPRRGPLGEIRTSSARGAGVVYVAYSHIASPPPAVLRRAAPLVDARQSNFLQLPSGLPSRIGDLARRIAGDKPTVYDQVVAVEGYLRQNYRYTLVLTHDPGREPVDEFLFVTRRGHCEYFASAMAVLLRQLGIHSRAVNGFAGGEWNAFGKYLAVRQGDAHAWVEVLFANVGWVAFDPTPAGGTASAPRAGVLGGLVQLVDTLRMRWFRHVVEYDLRQQMSMLQRAQGIVASGGGPRGSTAIRLGTPLVAGLAVLLVGLVLAHRWRRRRRRDRGPEIGATRGLPPAAQLYVRLLGLLQRAGHVKPAGATPREFAAGLRRSRFQAAELVERFTNCYYETRFGGAREGPEAQAELTGLLRELHRSLRARPSAP
jgi:hypothetical protein